MGAQLFRRSGKAVFSTIAALVLVACQSTGESPVAMRGTNDGDSLKPIVAAPPEATRPTPPPIPAARAIFRFDQVLGMPTVQGDVLSAALGQQAKARNLTLVRRGDPTATYRVLGYLSAVGGKDSTNVSYVWDIVDVNNNRLHRITGLELAGGASSDPWSGVSDAVLTTVAARTIEQIYAWVNNLPAPVPASVADGSAPSTL